MKHLKKTLGHTHTATTPVLECLTGMGLSDGEARVFAHLLAVRSATAANIARAVQLPRTTVYTLLSSLTVHGVVGVTFVHGVKHFTTSGAPALETLVRTEAEQLEQHKRSLELLKHIAPTTHNGSTSSTRFFEGIEGLKQVYIEQLRNAPHGAERLIIRDDFIYEASWSFTQTDAWRSLVSYWKHDKKLTTRVLVNKTQREVASLAQAAPEPRTTIRFLQDNNEVHNTAIYIVGNSTALLSTHNETLLGVLIYDEYITNTHRTLFNALWDQSKKKAQK